MKVIAIAHNKGGVGKSTIAMNTAYALLKSGYRVALMDTDKQGTTFACSQSVRAFSPEEKINPKEYDFLIIDTPPYLTSDYLKLFTDADIVIIPTRPNPADVIEIPKTASVYEQAKYKNPSLQGYIVFNANDPRTSMIELVREQVELTGLPIFETIINNRVSYARSLLDPEGVFSETDKEAHKEMMRFTEEILSKL